MTRGCPMTATLEHSGTANETDIPDTWHRSKMATSDWLRTFMRRRPQLALRTPKVTGLARATAFNRHNVKFFENL
jgi:hypothetical protein